MKIRISGFDGFLEINKPIKITASITLKGANDSLKLSNALLFELFHVASNNLIKFHIYRLLMGVIIFNLLKYLYDVSNLLTNFIF